MSRPPSTTDASPELVKTSGKQLTEPFEGAVVIDHFLQVLCTDKLDTSDITPRQLFELHAFFNKWVVVMTEPFKYDYTDYLVGCIGAKAREGECAGIIAFTLYAMRNDDNSAYYLLNDDDGWPRTVPAWMAEKMPPLWVKAYEKATHDKFNESQYDKKCLGDWFREAFYEGR